MPNLRVQTATGRISVFELNTVEVSIGRDTRNDLILDDPRVSRIHATIRRVERNMRLCDLASGNGTYVNGHRIPPNVDFKLADQDEIRIGGCTLIFNDIDPLRTNVENFQQILKKAPSDVLTTSGLSVTPSGQSDKAEHYRLELEKKERILRLFCELSEKLSTAFSLEEIYNKIFSIIFSVTPASRCFIFRKNDQEGFEQVGGRHRTSSETGDPLPISQVVFTKVATERVSLLLENKSQAEAIGSMSITHGIANIQSVMAAPIIGSKGLLGIIYADRLNSPESFSPNDLDVLNAVSVQMGIAINAVNSHERLQQQAQARASFERFLPRQVVDEILRTPNGIRLGGVRQKITSLFADIRGFTTLSEVSTPEVTVRLLNRYFTLVSEIIFRHGGTLDKYIGDGLMAIFGAPYGSPLDATLAVRAAVEMQRSMEKFNQQMVAERLPRVEIGIGINTGPAIVGYIGSETRLDYTAIGDTINTAARLEGLAGPGQILISENTMQSLDENFSLRPVEIDKLKGKSISLRVAEVIWKQPPNQ